MIVQHHSGRVQEAAGSTELGGEERVRPVTEGSG